MIKPRKLLSNTAVVQLNVSAYLQMGKDTEPILIRGWVEADLRYKPVTVDTGRVE